MISAVILTKNSQSHIKECLESLREFEEVIIYDNGSSDKTLEIAKGFENVKIIKGEFLGFGKSRNIAASYAKNDWILAIDSDEVLKELKISKLENSKVYAIKRTNLFLNEEVKYSGWQNDWVKRLYNKKFHRFNDSAVHESIEAKYVEKVPSKLIHYAVDDVTDFLLKSAKYAKMQRLKQKKLTPYQAFFRALFAFFKSYILKLGFLDGYKGLVIAVGSFNGVFFKYTYRFYNDLSHKSC